MKKSFLKNISQSAISGAIFGIMIVSVLGVFAYAQSNPKPLFNQFIDQFTSYDPQTQQLIPVIQTGGDFDIDTHFETDTSGNLILKDQVTGPKTLAELTETVSVSQDFSNGINFDDASISVVNGFIKFSDANGTTATIDPTQLSIGNNIGVGTTSPLAKLDIQTDGTTKMLNIGSATPVSLIFKETVTDPDLVAGITYPSCACDQSQQNTDSICDTGPYNETGGGECLDKFGGGVRIFEISRSQFAVDQNARVGIGINTPQAKLHVAGSAKIDGDLEARNISGNLTNMTVSGEYFLEVHNWDDKGVQLTPVENSICFLSDVHFWDLRRSDENHVQCQIRQSGDNWELYAYVRRDADVNCRARCLSW